MSVERINVLEYNVYAIQSPTRSMFQLTNQTVNYSELTITWLMANPIGRKTLKLVILLD